LNALAIGKKVKAGLQKAHAARHAQQKAQGQETILIVFRLAKMYLDGGYSRRGLAGRISRQLTREGRSLSEAHIRKIISRLLSGMRDSSDTVRQQEATNL
jgi:hypothetical protein